MSFRLTDLLFTSRPSAPTPPLGAALAWDGVASPGDVGCPGDLPVPPGQQLRRWGALLALAGVLLPGSAARSGDGRPVVPVVEAALVESAGGGDFSAWGPGGLLGGLPSGDAGEAASPAATAPWEAGVVEADGKPLPTSPPPGPVPVDGIPLPAGAVPATGSVAAPAPPKASPAAGETVRSVPNQGVRPPTGPADDLVPADREYLRPILVRYAQENGLPADLLMAQAWVESSWRRTTTSDAGAVGVMQLMPTTAEFVSKKLLGLKATLDRRDPRSNVRMGARYFRHLLDQNRGNFRQALIAYNQGPTSLRVYGSYGVAERYADRVLALRPQFRSA